MLDLLNLEYLIKIMEALLGLYFRKNQLLEIVVFFLSNFLHLVDFIYLVMWLIFTKNLDHFIFFLQREINLF